MIYDDFTHKLFVTMLLKIMKLTPRRTQYSLENLALVCVVKTLKLTILTTHTLPPQVIMNVNFQQGLPRIANNQYRL
jgi:hypothetical protein